MVIACVGIITNLTVVIVFLNNKKFRSKIPIIYIINQVRLFTFQYNLYDQLQCSLVEISNKISKTFTEKNSCGIVFYFGCSELK